MPCWFHPVLLGRPLLFEITQLIMSGVAIKMLPNRCLSGLGVAERRGLRHQWLRGGQCFRGFHPSRLVMAEGEGEGSNGMVQCVRGTVG